MSQYSVDNLCDWRKECVKEVICLDPGDLNKAVRRPNFAIFILKDIQSKTVGKIQSYPSLMQKKKNMTSGKISFLNILHTNAYLKTNHREYTSFKNFINIVYK